MTDQKLPEIDILRIISILIVMIAIHIPISYAYNFYIELDQYGMFLVNNVGIFVSMGSFVFVSGFGLYLSPNNRKLNSSKKKFSFLKKRFIRIFPLYWIAIVLFIFFVGYSNMDPLYLFYHFLGLQIIVAPYFGEPMLTLWFVGIIVIYYLIYLVLNSLGSIKLIIPASIGILFFFVFLSGATGLVENRFFLYYSLFPLGIIAASIYTSPLYERIKNRLRSIHPAFLLLIPLFSAILGFVGFQYLTQFCYSSFISEFGNYNLYFILQMNPDFYQLTSIIFRINLIIVAFIVFVFSLFNFIFRGLRLIFSKRKIESAASITAYSTYSVYLFHRIFLVIFVTYLTTILNIDMLDRDNFYIVLLFVPFIFLFSYLIQKGIDKVWMIVSRIIKKDSLKKI
ncbi:MAG: acyltransferase family protein [Promethearchaeota archaeon]